MMYSCAPATRSSSAVVKKGGRSLRVDIHCHYLNVDAQAKVSDLNPAQHEPQVKFANALTRETNVKQMQERAAKLSSIEVRLKDGADRLPFAPYTLVTFATDGSLLDWPAPALMVGAFSAPGSKDVVALGTHDGNALRHPSSVTPW